MQASGSSITSTFWQPAMKSCTRRRGNGNGVPILSTGIEAPISARASQAVA